MLKPKSPEDRAEEITGNIRSNMRPGETFDDALDRYLRQRREAITMVELQERMSGVLLDELVRTSDPTRAIILTRKTDVRLKPDSFAARVTQILSSRRDRNKSHKSM